MAGPRGFDLSGSKVIASVLATVTGAVAASYLGVAGTLIGAAVGSLASTIGTEIYRHYLIRSQERIKAAGVLIQHRTAGHPQADQHSAALTKEMARQAARPERGTELEQTQTLPGLGHDWRATQPAAGSGPSAAQRASGDVGAEDGGAPGGSAGPGSGADLANWWRGIGRRGWLAMGAVAAGIFVVVIAGITVFELAVGKPLTAAVSGQHSTGTTVSNALTGHSSGTASPHRIGRNTPQPTTPGSSGPAGSSTPATPSSPAPSGISPSPVTSTPASAQPSSAAPTVGSPAPPTAGGQHSGAATPAP